MQNDTELKATQERITFFQSMLAEARKHETVENYALMSGGYLAEIDRMYQEIRLYLSGADLERIAA